MHLIRLLPATGGEDAPVHLAVHALASGAGLRTSDGPASSPRRVGSSPSSPRGAAAMPPPPPFGARSRQASMSRPRPVAEADEEEALEAVVDATDDHRAAGAAVAGSGHSVRIAPGGVAVADILAADGGFRRLQQYCNSAVRGFLPRMPACK